MSKMTLIPKLIFDSDGDQPDNPFGDLIVTPLYSYKINYEKAYAKVYFLSFIPYDIAGYTQLINLIMSLPANFILHIYICSPGGAVATTFQILSALGRCKAKIVTHNIGIAASCGSLLLSAGNEIYIAPQATTMFHGSAHGGFDKSIRLKSNAEHIVKNMEYVFGKMIAKGILTQEEYENIMKKDVEYFIPADVMTERLKANNIWYSGGEE